MSSRHLKLASWITRKYRLRRAQAGTQTAAKQLRKQGVPLEVCLMILGIAPANQDDGRPLGLVELCSTRSNLLHGREASE